MEDEEVFRNDDDRHNDDGRFQLQGATTFHKLVIITSEKRLEMIDNKQMILRPAAPLSWR